MPSRILRFVRTTALWQQILFTFAVIWILVPAPSAWPLSQDENELNRLQAAAEDAMVANDPSGAALFSGRAALMASQLKKTSEDRHARAWLGAKEQLFRAEEQLYRGMAMFKLGGGQPPAANGVCGMLERAITMVGEVRAETSDCKDCNARSQEIETAAQEVAERAQAVAANYQCAASVPR